ncbi:putative quinol monooxygenase [Cellulomonas cellasea]|uniref:putative quinol monooxygenase n=1 Tax=Cellulomonas cellasea TaxID=43670 RepID=UPI0025A43C03|nr:putative quinol monooxygenase [Cellulomonas cellasea]MDM8083323.1 putative quinol monooxygenase [Cellulomonas cellasea]
MTIKVIARSVVRPHSLPEALRLYEALVKETVLEPGCHSYELFQDIDDPHRLTLIEEWEDLQALDLHTKTPHFVDLVSQLTEHEDELPVHRYSRVF